VNKDFHINLGQGDNNRDVLCKTTFDDNSFMTSSLFEDCYQLLPVVLVFENLYSPQMVELRNNK